MAFCIINRTNYFHNLSLVEKQIKKDKIAVVLKKPKASIKVTYISKVSEK